jgi:hypothetical protein
MRLDKMFTGTGGEIKSLDESSWKWPAITGIVLIAVYAVYELAKLCLKLASDAMLYHSYSIDHGYYVAYEIAIAVVGLAAVIMSLACSISASRGGMEPGRSISVTIACVSAVMITLAVLAIVRVSIDITLLGLVPVNAWLYRFYDGGVMISEWTVIPDLLVNFSLVFGSILVAASAIDLSMKSLRHALVMESGDVSNPEHVTIDGKSFEATCKEIGKMKACKID